MQTLKIELTREEATDLLEMVMEHGHRHQHEHREIAQKLFEKIFPKFED